MISKINYKGFEYTLARANTGAVCLNVYDNSSKEFIFASGICKNKEQLLALIKKTKTNYNDILNQCLTRVKI